MRMRVLVESRDFRKTVSLKSGTVSELFAALGMGEEGFIVSKNGRMLLGDDRLSGGDRVRLHPVVSGG